MDLSTVTLPLLDLLTQGITAEAHLSEEGPVGAHKVVCHSAKLPDANAAVPTWLRAIAPTDGTSACPE
jgi:hypothetical protein